MKKIALLLVLLTAGGCTLAPQLSTKSPTADTTSATSSTVTFNKLYASGVAACGSLYTLIEGGYRSGKISKPEAVELKGKVDHARAALDEARVLQVTNAPTAPGKLSSALISLQTIRESVMNLKQRTAA